MSAPEQLADLIEKLRRENLDWTGTQVIEAMADAAGNLRRKNPGWTQWQVLEAIPQEIKSLRREGPDRTITADERRADKRIDEEYGGDVGAFYLRAIGRAAEELQKLKRDNPGWTDAQVFGRYKEELARREARLRARKGTFCTACGAENPMSAQFCCGCGAPIYRPDTESPKPPGIAPAQAATLKCPHCGLINPAAAERCDCGCDFLTRAVKEPSPEEQTRLRGVRGWLLLFCIITAIINPVLFVVGAASWSSVALVVHLAFAGLAVFTGVSVWAVRKNALRLVKVYLVALLCLGLIEGALGIVLTLSRPPGQAGTGPGVNNASGVLRAVIGFAIWWSYFKKSKRVRATFGSNLGVRVEVP